MKPGVNLNEKLIAFLNGLRSKLSFDPVVTSGIRTPHEQAVLMLDGTADIRTLYGSSAGAEIADRVERGAGIAEVEALIKAQIARGVFVSPHLRQSGLDFRTNNLSKTQSDELWAAVEETGARPLVEFDHLHVGSIEDSVVNAVVGATYRARNFTRKTLPWLLAGSAAITVVGLTVYSIRRRR